MSYATPESTAASPISPPNAVLDQTLIEAIGHHQAGRAAEAEALYRAILASPSIHAIASYSLGLLYYAQGRLPEAVTAYRQAIAIRNDFVDAYINLGATLLALGQHEEAVTLYRYATVMRPDNALAHGNLGKALQDLGRLGEAVAAYQMAIAYQPDNAIVQANLGAALLEQKAWDQSVSATRRAIALQPDNTMAYANLGAALLPLGKHDEALAACRKAIALSPQHAMIYASLGGVLMELGAFHEAVAACRHAIDRDPSLPIAHFNLSHAYKGLNRLAEAALAARQAIALRPDFADYHFHLAHILLLQGDLAAGWAEYDWRWKLADFEWLRRLQEEYAKPIWTGQDISNKTILICTEQGLGDIVQFARYLPLVASRASRVVVAARQPMKRLLEAIDGIEVVPLDDRPLPSFDVMCPLLSLPRAFQTRLDSIPASVPYLHTAPAERARWAGRMAGDTLRVGIVWAGNPVTQRDRFRSPRLASMTPLFQIPDVRFVALQMGPGREDCATNPLPANVLDLGADITDLADTAAIMTGLDLMISSCTGPLHLAGALGVPTWAIIPFAPHFPWLLDRSDTPWYPSMRLYRQDRPGQDWASVVNRMALDLDTLSRSRGARQV